MQKKISAVIITKNSERLIADVLKSIQWCDEIVIVDSGSADNTLEICKKYNCQIFHREFNGFGEQKNFAVNQASNDWILSIDADEIITDELREEIKFRLADDTEKYSGYYIPINLFFFGKLLNFGGSKIKRKLRLFNKKYGNFNLNKVHESVELSFGKIGQLKNKMLHYSYASISDYFVKFNSYTDIAAEELLKKNKFKNFCAIVIRFPVEFLKRYILQLGILDGRAGFVWCLFCAFYPVVKYLKLYELKIIKK